MTGSDRPRVLIVGGGVGGSALALFLAEVGVSAVVYEAYPFLSGVGGGVNIAPNGMQVLAALGLAERLTRAATPVPVNYFLDGEGQSLGEVPYGVAEVYGQPAVGMSRALLYESLAAEMKARGVLIEYDKRVVEVEEATAGVVVWFADGTSAAGDCLVGADGARSIVRRHLLPDGPGAEYVGMVGIGGFTSLDRLTGVADREIHAQTLTYGTNFFGYSGADTGAMMWWTNLWRDREYTREELAELDEEALKRELLEKFAGFHEPIPQLIAHSERTIRMNVYDIRTLPTWHNDRIVLIGDAAHTVSPNSGQGASMALEDAMYLAKLIREHPGDYPAAFAALEQARRSRVEEIVAEGRHRGGDKKTVSPEEALTRNNFMKIGLEQSAKNTDPDPWLSYKISW